MDDITPEQADPNFIDPDGESPLDSPEALERTIDNARKSFSLRDRLNGIKQRHTKLLIFTDGPAVDEVARIDIEVENLGAQVMLAASQTKEGQEVNPELDRLTKLHDDREAELERARQALYETALSIHMVAYPNIAVKVARREARSKFMPESKVMGPEETERSNEWMEWRLLGECIVKIVDSSGASLELESPREKVGQMFNEMLPPSQWDRLQKAYLLLVAADSIGSLATDDPGF